MFAALSPFLKRNTAAVSSSASSGVNSSDDLTMDDMAHKYALTTAASSAMIKLLNAQGGASYAIKLLGALHVHTPGADVPVGKADADAYVPLRSLSPLTSAQLGPTGPSTVFELAKALIANPHEGTRRSFERGFGKLLDTVKDFYLRDRETNHALLIQLLEEEPALVLKQLDASRAVMEEAVEILTYGDTHGMASAGDAQAGEDEGVYRHTRSRAAAPSATAGEAAAGMDAVHLAGEPSGYPSIDEVLKEGADGEVKMEEQFATPPPAEGAANGIKEEVPSVSHDDLLQHVVDMISPHLQHSERERSELFSELSTMQARADKLEEKVTSCLGAISSDAGDASRRVWEEVGEMVKDKIKSEVIPLVHMVKNAEDMHSTLASNLAKLQAKSAELKAERALSDDGLGVTASLAHETKVTADNEKTRLRRELANNSELQRRLQVQLAASEEQLGSLSMELARVAEENSALRSAATAIADAPAPTPSASSGNGELLAKTLEELKLSISQGVEQKASELKAGQGERMARLEYLEAENSRLRSSLDASSAGRRVAFDLETPQTLRATSPGHDGDGSLRDSRVSAMVTEIPSDMPLLSDWAKLPLAAGHENIKPPDYAAAWTARPDNGDAGKAARKQLALDLSPEKLLVTVPKEGEVLAYGLQLPRMLENWFMYANYLSGGGHKGEVSLLRALVRCATLRHNTVGKNESWWRSLMGKESVLDFLKELNGIFSDRNHVASESEWQSAATDCKDAFDLFTKMRHLMVDEGSRKRGRFELTKYLGKHADKSTLRELMSCNLDDLDSWQEVLSSSRSVEEQIANASASKKKGILGADLLAMAKSKTTVDQSKYASGNVMFDTDINLNEAVMIFNALKDAQASKQDVEEIKKQLAAVVGAVGSQSSTSNIRPRINFQSPPGMCPKVLNLPALKEFIGAAMPEVAAMPVPERRGPHPSGTHGPECFICASLGIKKFEEFEKHKAAGFPPDQRTYHNAWKCQKVEQAVRNAQTKTGASEEEVNKVLTLIDDPFWKPRGA